MRNRKHRNYSYEYFDQHLSLRPGLCLVVAMLYLSKNFSLPLVAFAFGRGIDGHMSYILEGTKHPFLFLLSSLPALLVILAWSRRLPNAGWSIHFIWEWGRWFLITSVILDTLLILILDRSFSKDLEQIYLFLDSGVLGFLLINQRVRNVFNDFPAPDLPSTNTIPVRRVSKLSGAALHEAFRVAEQMVINDISGEIGHFLREIKTAEKVPAKDWSVLAMRSIEAGQLENAVTFFKAASHLEPNNQIYSRNICEIFRRLGLFDTAVKYGLDAVNIAPDDPISHFNLALAQSQYGQTELSLMSYHKALTIDPSYMEGWSNMGILLKSMGREEEAHQAMQRSISIRTSKTSLTG